METILEGDPLYFLAPCEEADWVGDGYCDDGNNHKDCNYDGGDCCGQVDKKYCADCICHEGGFQLLDLIITELKSHMTC